MVERISSGNMERVAAALDVHASTVAEFRPSASLTTLGETGAGAAVKTGSPRSDARNIGAGLMWRAATAIDGTIGRTIAAVHLSRLRAGRAERWRQIRQK